MSKDKVVELRLLEDPEQLASVIWDLAATGSVASTRRRYKLKYGKGLDAKHVQAIQVRYKEKIKQLRENLNSEEALKECAALTKRARAEILLDVIESGLEERFVGVYSYKDEATGEEVKKPMFKQDLNSVLVALRLLKDEVHGAKDLELKEKKMKGAKGGEDEEEYEADDGVEDEAS